MHPPAADDAGVDGVINVSGCGARGAYNYDASLDKSRET